MALLLFIIYLKKYKTNRRSWLSVSFLLHVKYTVSQSER